MNMLETFDEIPLMTHQDIKETKRYRRTRGRMDRRTDGQCENSIPNTNKVCGGYNKKKDKKTKSCLPWLNASFAEKVQPANYLP